MAKGTTDFLSRLGVASDDRQRGTRDKKGPAVAVAGLERYGALAKVTKEISDGFMVTEGGPIKNAMFAHFIAEGLALGRCPVNYDGTEGKVDKASLQLKRKTSQSTIKPEHVERFQAHKIRLEQEVSAPHTLRIIPEVFSANQKLMNEMLGCLVKNGFDVDAIFETQLEKSRWIVAVNTLDDLFAVAKAAREKNAKNFPDTEIRELLEICSSMSIMPHWDGTFEEAFDMVVAMIEDPKMSAAASETMKAASKSKSNDAPATNGGKPVNGAKPTATKPAVDPITAAMAKSLAEASGGVYSRPANQPRSRR